MQGASRESLKAARETLGALIRSSDTDLPAVSDELFSVTALLDREHPLRRALTDPARDGDARVGLARAVLGEQVGGATADLLAWVVRARWSVPRDLATALELLAVEAQVAAAERAGRLDEVEDELFRVSRSVAGAPELRTALSDLSAPVESRAALIEGLLGGRTTEETRRLVRQAVVAPRGRTFDRTVGDLRPGRRRPAQPPGRDRHRRATPSPRSSAAGWPPCCSGSTVTRCTSTSSSTPTLVGGIRVEIGDEVIDGSVESRLDDARRRLVG